MKFCLILCTKNRVDELKAFFDSLKIQTHKDFKVIIVDQNEDNRLDSLIEDYKGVFELIHSKSQPGLSRARNKGLELVGNEDIIAFPDDDCEYFENTLELVEQILQNNHNLHGVTGKSIDKDFVNSAGRFESTDGLINIKNVWSRGISFTIFLKRNVVNEVGSFDENLGVGSGTLWGSGEETDYLIRAVNQKFDIYYTEELQVIHPNPTTVYNQSTFKRALSYGGGLGKVVSKHKYSFLYKLKILIRPIGGILISLMKLNKKQAMFYFYTLKGRIIGLTN